MKHKSWLDNYEQKLPRVLVVSYGRSFEKIDLGDLLEFNEKTARAKLKTLGRRTQTVSQVLATVRHTLRSAKLELAVTYGKLYEKVLARFEMEQRSVLKAVIESHVFSQPAYVRKHAVVSELEYQAEVLENIVKALRDNGFALGRVVGLQTAETTTYRDT